MVDINQPFTAEELNNAGTTDKVTPAIPIMPVPTDAPKPTKLVEFYNKKYGMQKPTAWYRYYNVDGETLGYVMRWDFVKDGKPHKEIRPFLYCEFPSGEKKWHSCGFPEPRPLYNLHEIYGNPDKAILVCEGEKAAEAARKRFPDHVVTTSCGGSNAALKTDWSHMKGRNVFISIDYDQAGQQYGDEVRRLCKEAGARTIKLLSPKIFANYTIQDGHVVESVRELPEHYDLADAAQEGWTAELIKKLKVMLHEKEQSLFVDYCEPNCEIELDEEEWSEPEPIKCELLPVKPLPLDIIPEPLQPWLKDIAHRMQCPLEHVAVPAMIMFGSIIGAECGIRPKKYDDWLVIPNLWGGIVGAPGTLKSPALEEALKPLNALESKAQKQHEADMKNYLKELKDYELAKKNSQDVEEPIEPICRRFKTNDPTIEKLGELLKQNPRGLSLVRDELIGLLVTWDKKGHESDRAFALQAWNGYGSYTTDRIGRGTVHCDNMCISIVGSTQPSKLSRYLQETVNNTGNDGLMQRFQLLVYPDENGAWKYVDQSPNCGAQKLVFEIAEKVASGNSREYGAIIEEGCTPYFHFSDDAQSFFIQWLTEHESTKVRNSKDSEIIVQHLSKYRSLMPTIALIFHLIDIVGGKIKPGPVTLDSAKRAAAWCDYLETHARRIYGTVLTQSKTSQLTIPPSAITLSEKIKSGQLKDGFTIRDVYRNNWRGIGDKSDAAKKACDVLVQMEWLKVETSKSSKGQDVETYRINPKLGIADG